MSGPGRKNVSESDEGGAVVLGEEPARVPYGTSLSTASKNSSILHSSLLSDI